MSDALVASRELDFGDFRVEEAWFAPGGRIGRHVHERAVFAVFLEGSMETRIGERTLVCRGATVLNEPSGEPHVQRFGTAGAHIVVVQPDPAGEGFRPFRGVFDEISHYGHAEMAGLARAMAREMGAADGAVAVEALGLELVAVAAGVGSRIDGRPPRWLRQARELVHDRYLEPLRVAEVADAVGIHRVHLTRAFRRYYRAPIGTYLRNLRLDWAARRLVETDEPLPALSLRAGFADQSHFTHAFRRFAGTTPGRYRAARRAG
ncbi:MAG TPA: AraC family transcriptional regulator [Gemmatimonadota bacterium]|nr:AraC family transcriptional regulator [Gemmatimonadota bacterium]